MEIKEFVKQRINENKNLFEPKELEIIEKNENFIKKIYLLGGMDNANAMLGGKV